MNFYIYGYLVLFGVVFGILAYIVLSKPKKTDSKIVFIQYLGGCAPNIRMDLGKKRKNKFIRYGKI